MEVCYSKGFEAGICMKTHKHQNDFRRVKCLLSGTVTTKFYNTNATFSTQTGNDPKIVARSGQCTKMLPFVVM